jgi:hypothetical protein
VPQVLLARPVPQVLLLMEPLALLVQLVLAVQDLMEPLAR